MTVFEDQISATVNVRGRFAVRAADGTDLTPPYRKERALLALLAMSSQCRCSRSEIQSKLWSDKPQDKASANLRRALSNLRSFLGAQDFILHSNRLELWLDPSVQIDTCPTLEGRAELLEMVEAPDPEFDDWLRDIRSADAAKIEKQNRPTAIAPANYTEGTVIVIRSMERATLSEAQFLETHLIDALSSRLEAEGAGEIYAAVEPDPARLEHASVVIFLELTSIVDGRWWNVHLRALAGTERRFLWSGQNRVPLDINRLADGMQINAFVSLSLSQIFLRFQNVHLPRKSALVSLQRAVGRLYVSNIGEIEKAEAELVDLHSEDIAGVALAWRAFARLAQAMEFPDHNPRAKEEALELSRQAFELQSWNPMVCGLASRVALDLEGDTDRADYYAQAGVQSNDGNPYALLSASRVALAKGDYDMAHALAQNARSAAQGLRHSHSWDMEVCVSALALGDVQTACDASAEALRKHSSYRAALRYSVFAHNFLGHHQEEQQAIATLRRFEPNFQLTDFLREDYPMQTLRRTGYTEQLNL